MTGPNRIHVMKKKQEEKQLTVEKSERHVKTITTVESIPEVQLADFFREHGIPSIALVLDDLSQKPAA
jgi:hypothetical protein